jgi:hypothetical protein
MALEETRVHRQLEARTRLGRFDYSDGNAVLLTYTVAFFASKLFGFRETYCYVVMVAAAAAVVVLRLQFEEGLFGILEYVLAPKHLSAHARDYLQRPYPGSRLCSPNARR